jgi:hypothetical protein
MWKNQVTTLAEQAVISLTNYDEAVDGILQPMRATNANPASAIVIQTIETLAEARDNH